MALRAGALLCLLGASLQGEAPAPPPAQPKTQPKPRPKARRRTPPHPKPIRRWPGQGEPEVERIRKCILKRESEGNYAAVDRDRRWFGGYQFEQPTSDTAARRMKRPDLVGIPANQWAPADQDAAFYLIYDRGRGSKHWAGGRYPCE